MSKADESLISDEFDIPEEAYNKRSGGDGYDLFLLDAVKKSRFYAGKTASNANSAANRFRKNNPRYEKWRFYAKEKAEKGIDGVRVWRIPDAPDGEPEPKPVHRLSGSAAETFNQQGDH